MSAAIAWRRSGVRTGLITGISVSLKLSPARSQRPTKSPKGGPQQSLLLRVRQELSQYYSTTPRRGDNCRVKMFRPGRREAGLSADLPTPGDALSTCVGLVARFRQAMKAAGTWVRFVCSCAGTVRMPHRLESRRRHGRERLRPAPGKTRLRTFQNWMNRGWQGQERSGWPCDRRSGPSLRSDLATRQRGFETSSCQFETTIRRQKWL
jgi:hypothetical protein